MNSLDPSLAKYLSKSKQDIYEQYHGSSSSGGSGLKKKKKSKKHDNGEGGSNGAGLIIADDADDGLNPWSRTSGMLVDGADDDRQPVVEHRSSAAFRPVASTSAPPATSAAADDAIPADEAPVVVGSVVEEAPTASSSSSAFTQKRLKGGLQTSSQLKEENARRRQAAEAEREKAMAQKVAAESTGTATEDTVYRDASGKKINTKEAKAELARIKRKEMEKEMQKMEWGKGLVQREERDKKKQEVEDMANKPFARFVDDDEINDELKEKDRWNDPAARFLSNDKRDKKKKGPVRPKYSGPPPPPNRFNILPGYRWDGVDRSNGFERELVQAANKRKVNAAAARLVSTEDM